MAPGNTRPVIGVKRKAGSEIQTDVEAASDLTNDDFARREFNKNRKIIIRDVPPVTYNVSMPFK